MVPWKINWAVLSDEQMSNGYPFSLVNDEQMSNKVGVEHQPVSERKPLLEGPMFHWTMIVGGTQETSFSRAILWFPVTLSERTSTVGGGSLFSLPYLP